MKLPVGEKVLAEMVGDDDDFIFLGFDDFGRDVDTRGCKVEPGDAGLADFDSGAHKTIVFELDGKV